MDQVMDDEGGILLRPPSRTSWAPEEDAHLYHLVVRYDACSWTATAVGLNSLWKTDRSAKQCRERWISHVNPSIRRDYWTAAEDVTIVNMQKRMGNSWAGIARRLSGRSVHSVKNRFHQLKRLKRTTPRSLLVEVHSSSSMRNKKTGLNEDASQEAEGRGVEQQHDAAASCSDIQTAIDAENGNSPQIALCVALGQMNQQQNSDFTRPVMACSECNYCQDPKLGRLHECLMMTVYKVFLMKECEGAKTMRTHPCHQWSMRFEDFMASPKDDSETHAEALRRARRVFNDALQQWNDEH